MFSVPPVYGSEAAAHSELYISFQSHSTYLCITFTHSTHVDCD